LLISSLFIVLVFFFKISSLFSESVDSFEIHIVPLVSENKVLELIDMKFYNEEEIIFCLKTKNESFEEFHLAKYNYQNGSYVSLKTNDQDFEVIFFFFFPFLSFFLLF